MVDQDGRPPSRHFVLIGRPKLLAFSVGQSGQPIDNAAVDTFLRQAIVNIAITVPDTHAVRK